ncbi:MAG: pyridoxamine 5'-phosphate oxidase family protein [Clostridiales bacterium]|nr:pyridoxamine 5'-phosphate oxidase family protein [Clostridiales bacterium]
MFEFITEQKTAFIASVNGQGYPVIRAMLAPRKIDGNDIYFTTKKYGELSFSRRIFYYLSSSSLFLDAFTK